MDLDLEWHRGYSAVDVFEWLKEREESLPTFRKYKGRKDLVVWMHDIGLGKGSDDPFEMKPSTIHLAVYLFDYFIDDFTFQHDLEYVDGVLHDAALYAAASLSLATKFDDPNLLRPLELSLIKSLERFYPDRQLVKIREAEIIVLEAVEYRLHVPTCVSYVPYLIAFSDGDGSFGVRIRDNSACLQKSFSDKDRKNYQYVSEAGSKKKPGGGANSKFSECRFFDTLVLQLCRLSLGNVKYFDHKPSLIAASALFVARFCIHAVPTWPSTIATLTGYDVEDLNDCTRQMLSDFLMEREANPFIFTQLSVTVVDSVEVEVDVTPNLDDQLEEESIDDHDEPGPSTSSGASTSQTVRRTNKYRSSSVVSNVRKSIKRMILYYESNLRAEGEAEEGGVGILDKVASKVDQPQDSKRKRKKRRLCIGDDKCCEG